MLVNGIDMDVFLDQFKKVIMSVVVKQTKRAAEYETVDTKRDGDKYITMIEGGDNWATYVKFHREVLIAAGINHLILDQCQYDKENIPYELRKLVMRLERSYIIDNYIEKNNYYRMLHGEPNMEDTDLIYVPKNKFGVSTSTPIHLLRGADIQYFNSSTMRDELISKYPDKEYLQHLGDFAIPYYNARVARNYEMLHITKPDRENIMDEFVTYYGAARNYVMMGLYTKNDAKMYENYDEFMGLIIMTMAIQRLFASIFKQGITRDFYDDNLIRSLFESYNVPYYEEIDITYQREIAKKLNVLLQAKSTNAVIFDITSIFNFTTVNIYKYYLMKDYRKDDNGDPIIEHKTVVDEDGNETIVIDYENTFNLYFQKVNINNYDPTSALTDPSNRVEYYSITGGDPYWINDADLLNKIYSNNFNSLITKYMSIDVIFHITRIMYETCHTFRMILDKNDDFKQLEIPFPKYTSQPVSLYDMVIYICALVVKKFGLTGEIPLKGYQIANVYGFNFHTDINIIRNEIINDITENKGQYKDVDPQILTYLKDLVAPTLDDAKKMYEDIENLRKFIDDVLRKTKSLEVYEAYMKIYWSILIVEDVDYIYKKKDGEVAKTYKDLIDDRRQDLADIVDKAGTSNGGSSSGGSSGSGGSGSGGSGSGGSGGSGSGGSSSGGSGTSKSKIDTDDINKKINDALDALSDTNEKIKDIKGANDKSDIVKDIEKLINTVKSYTVDNSDSSILYIVDDPHMCMLKILDKMASATVGDWHIDDELKMLYYDLIAGIKISNRYDEKLEMEHWYFEDKTDLIKLYIKILNRIKMITKDVTLERELSWIDLITLTGCDEVLKPEMGLIKALENFNDSRVDEYHKFPLSDAKLAYELVNYWINKNLYIRDSRYTIADIWYQINLKLLHQAINHATVWVTDTLLSGSLNTEYNDDIRLAQLKIMDIIEAGETSIDTNLKLKIKEWILWNSNITYHDKVLHALLLWDTIINQDLGSDKMRLIVEKIFAIQFNWYGEDKIAQYVDKMIDWICVETYKTPVSLLSEGYSMSINDKLRHALMILSDIVECGDSLFDIRESIPFDNISFEITVTKLLSNTMSVNKINSQRFYKSMIENNTVEGKTFLKRVLQPNDISSLLSMSDIFNRSMVNEKDKISFRHVLKKQYN